MKMLSSSQLRKAHYAALFKLIFFTTLSFGQSNELQLPPVATIRTDGSKTNSSIHYTLQSTSKTPLTVNDSFAFNAVILPDIADIGKSVDLFNVVVFNNELWMLNLDGVYVPWSGRFKDLIPFKQNIALSRPLSIQLFSGKIIRHGNYKFYTGYAPASESTLEYTHTATNLTIIEAPLSNKTNQIENLFAQNIEIAIIQNKCILCHVDGAIARNSALRFVRTNSSSAQVNLETIKQFILTQADGKNRLLTKASGGNEHPGGIQLPSNSAGYKSLAELVDLVSEEQLARDIPALFPPQNAANSENFLEAIGEEPLNQTLRRAARILGNRLPTAHELELVNEQAQVGLEKALDTIMSGKGFHAFILAGVNDRLFLDNTQAIGDSAATNDVNYPEFARMNYEFISKVQSYNRLAREHWDRILPAWSYTAGELIAYVIETEKPYSEILTANYMMMNRVMNEGYRGTAKFSKIEDDSVFKPSQIQGYFQPNQIDFNKTKSVVIDNFTVFSHIELLNPAAPFPHAGILSDMTFLARYPTTATNRNRARARWTLYHFLDLDIEASSQRPTNEAALQDTNNPTMNNANCSVCHAILDPVAASFQNWDERNQYRPNGQALDRLYKSPDNGGKSLYQNGDSWYRDMRPPGLFERKILNNNDSLQELSQLIVKEPSFYKAAIKFWWLPIFGELPLEIPVNEADFNFANKLAAYQAQQEFIKELADQLSRSKNMKNIFKKMVLSVWFRGQSVSNLALNSVIEESRIASKQLLNPAQLQQKIEDLTGLVHGRPRRRDIYNGLPTQFTFQGTIKAEEVSLGGHNSDSVLSRRELVSPLMMNVYLYVAQDLSCPAVAYDFLLPKTERRLFNLVQIDNNPENSMSLIKQQISRLIKIFLGYTGPELVEEVEKVYFLFNKSIQDTPQIADSKKAWNNCNVVVDYYAPTLLGVDPERLRSDNQNDKLDPLKLRRDIDFGEDKGHIKSSWSIVIFYLLSHPDFIYE